MIRPEIMSKDDGEVIEMTMKHLALRVEQLGEIRAMLRLPVDATHEAVIERLHRLALPPLVNRDAVPERYRRATWFKR
jgi:hypothetical protein